MATWLRQSTSVDVPIGPFLDETDGKTAETGLTITQPDVRLKKNNGNWAQKNAAQSLSHEEAGWYEVTLDATDTNTLGVLIVAVHESGALPVWREFLVVPAQVWDSYLAGDLLQVHAAEISNDLITASAIAANAIGSSELADGAITAAKLAADAITAAKLAADVGAEIADAVWDEALSGHNGAGSTGEALADAGGAGTPPTAAEVADAVWDEDITTHTTASTTGQRLSRLPNVTAGGNGGVVLADANGRAKADLEHWRGSQPNALTSGRVEVMLGAVSAGAIAAASFASGAFDAVWAVATRVLTAGTNIALAKGAGVTGFNDLDAAAVRSAVGLSSPSLDTQLAALPTAAENAGAVWDEALSGHLGAGSTGEALQAAASSGIAGPGALIKTIRILIAAAPVQGAAVWVATDAGGSNVIAGPLITDSFGVVTVLLDAGTYYVWARKDGMTPVLGDAIVAA